MKKTALAAALGLSAMLVYGCSNDSKVDTATNEQPTATETQKDIISIDEIKAKALKEIEGGEVTSVEQDDKKGIRMYELDVVTDEVKYELTYDAHTGDLLKKEEERRDQTNNGDVATGDATKEFKVTEEQAKDIAMKKVGEGEISKFELDRSDQKYEIEIKTATMEYDVDVDANTGDIVKYKEDTRD